MRRLAAFLALAAAVLPLRGNAATETVFGYWMVENRRAIVQIAPCGFEVCGRMVWLEEPLDEAGKPKRDARGAPLCGIALVAGFQPSGSGSWENGNIYNPRDGNSYSARMTLIDDNRLEVRGYVGLPLFGQSQVWTRATDNRGGC